MNFIEHLAIEIERTGHKVTSAGAGFSIEPIGLKVEAEVGERVVHNGFDPVTVAFTIRIKATHDIMFPEGIWDELAGFGVDDDGGFVLCVNDMGIGNVSADPRDLGADRHRGIPGSETRLGFEKRRNRRTPCLASLSRAVADQRTRRDAGMAREIVFNEKVVSLV